MKSTLQKIFEFKTPYHFLAPTIAVCKKNWLDSIQLVGAVSLNSPDFSFIFAAFLLASKDLRRQSL